MRVESFVCRRAVICMFKFGLLEKSKVYEWLEFVTSLKLVFELELELVRKLKSLNLT